MQVKSLFEIQLGAQAKQLPSKIKLLSQLLEKTVSGYDCLMLIANDLDDLFSANFKQIRDKMHSNTDLNCKRVSLLAFHKVFLKNSVIINVFNELKGRHKVEEKTKNQIKLLESLKIEKSFRKLIKQINGNCLLFFKEKV